MQQSLSRENNEKLAEVFGRQGKLRHYSPGQLLVERGTPADKACFIASGRARTFCANTAGDIITLFYIEPGNMICSEALLTDSLVKVSVEAITPVDMYVMPAEEFLHCWEARGNSVRDLIAPLIDRLTLLSDYICCAHFRDNKKRVAYFLHSAYRRLGEIIPYSNEQVADITGINRVSANRILNAFARDGLLELSYRKIRILDVEKLAAVFDSLGYFLG